MERCNCKHIVTAEKCFLACSDYCKEEKHCHLKTQTRNNHVLDVVPGRLLCRQVLVNGAPDFKQHPSSIQRMQTWPARAATSLCFLGFFARKRRCRQWSEIWRPNSWLLPRYCFFEKGNIAIRSWTTESEYQIASGIILFVNGEGWQKRQSPFARREKICAPVTRPGVCFQSPATRIEQRPERFWRLFLSSDSPYVC